MNSEIELKLLVTPGGADKVARLPWLRKLSGNPEHRRLRTVYFDTRRLELYHHGVVLRVRRSGNKHLQSIKARGNAYGAFERGEWEYEVPGDAPDLKLAKETPLAPLATRKLKRKLRPVFETIVERTTFPIHADGADLELAVDRGYIATRGTRRRERISEIEIEVKGGDAEELSRIAKRLARSVEVAYAPRSKGDRGFALSCKKPDAPVRGAPILLDAGATAGEAFRAIGFSCLDHALANERAVRQGDTEGVHQMRIGLRRLRAAISIFKEMLRGPETEAVKRELKWLTERLSPARDLDVLIAGQVHPLRAAQPLGADAGVLERDLNLRRKAGMEQARAAVDGDRYRASGLQAALWLAYGAWSRSGAASIKACRDMPVNEFAAEILAERSRRILKKTRKLERLDPRARHKLRIAVKKLRYACEFFAGVFSGGKQDTRRVRFGKALQSLQGSLGTLNDIEVHKRFAHSIARSGDGSTSRSREALAMGFITGREDKQVASCLSDVGKSAARLKKSPEFWK
jgi:inorganic triphosphatase YgiF